MFNKLLESPLDWKQRKNDLKTTNKEFRVLPHTNDNYNSEKISYTDFHCILNELKISCVQSVIHTYLKKQICESFITHILCLAFPLDRDNQT